MVTIYVVIINSIIIMIMITTMMMAMIMTTTVTVTMTMTTTVTVTMIMIMIMIMTIIVIMVMITNVKLMKTMMMITTMTTTRIIATIHKAFSRGHDELGMCGTSPQQVMKLDALSAWTIVEGAVRLANLCRDGCVASQSCLSCDKCLLVRV